LRAESAVVAMPGKKLRHRAVNAFQKIPINRMPTSAEVTLFEHE